MWKRLSQDMWKGAKFGGVNQSSACKAAGQAIVWAVSQLITRRKDNFPAAANG
jgi:hypothetical protein